MCDFMDIIAMVLCLIIFFGIYGTAIHGNVTESFDNEVCDAMCKQIYSEEYEFSERHSRDSYLACKKEDNIKLFSMGGKNED